jgi:hypothetical protein
MNGHKADPPRLGIALLRHGCAGRYNEALVGDLIEKFRSGQTRGWFWRQVVIALAISALGKSRKYWPYVCYASMGVIISFFADADTLRQVPRWLRWSDLPWPISQLAFELSRSGLLALAALSILAVGLVIEQSFHWVSLLLTGLLSLTFIALGHYSIDFFPWLLRPVADDRFHRSDLIVPGSIQVLLSFCAFLMAALLGCQAWRGPDGSRGKVEGPRFIQ